MQLMPAAAKDTGFDDVSRPEENLHAGIRHVAWLRDTYFSDPALPESVRVDFALTAQNGGPGPVRRWRAAALDEGIDPNRWFGQVENLATANVGLEPVRYVGNINKYYELLTRLLDEQARSEAARHAAPGGQTR